MTVEALVVKAFIHPPQPHSVCPEAKNNKWQRVNSNRRPRAYASLREREPVGYTVGEVLVLISNGSYNDSSYY